MLKNGIRGDNMLEENALIIDDFKGKYWFLSNFYKCAIKYEGLLYPSTEHAYQAAKSLDKSKRKEFTEFESPRVAKNLGRSVKLRDDWELVKRYVMKNLLKIKFENPYLRLRLHKTKGNYLVEGNYWHDNIWGNCSCDRPECIPVGQNILGLLLMEIRDEVSE
jgi:ribA/ribD-fused uncharacterized protein